ncbi:tyrosine-type recombinase/integrase [Nocardia sp. NPDC051990]|uniref:tyrosine-type recombinase/integrase n=1 Tax=Nocardia sp. NPDC051990 TaxID=3155285 RepID=UPI00344762C7
MPPRWRPHAEFNLVSMARPSEVTAIQIRDFDKRNGDVRINKAGKHVGGEMKLGKPKSSRGIRTVTVPLETLERFDLDRPGEELLVHTSNDTPISAGYFYAKAWVPGIRRLRALADGNLEPFGPNAQWKRADPDYLLERFADAIASMRHKRLTPYTLRHTGISWKLQVGVPLLVVSRDAGHKSVNTTDARYGHNDRRASAAAAQVIANRLPRARAAMLRAPSTSPRPPNQQDIDDGLVLPRCRIGHLLEFHEIRCAGGIDSSAALTLRQRACAASISL